MSPHSSTPNDSKTATNTAAAMDIQGSDYLANGMSHSPVKNDHPPTAHQHIWYITGPAGCGKSTVAQYIASSLGLPFKEGDNVRSFSKHDSA
jgi:gluconokinase